jgi:hypothetical protein
MTRAPEDLARSSCFPAEVAGGIDNRHTGLAALYRQSGGLHLRETPNNMQMWQTSLCCEQSACHFIFFWARSYNGESPTTARVRKINALFPPQRHYMSKGRAVIPGRHFPNPFGSGVGRGFAINS